MRSFQSGLYIVLLVAVLSIAESSFSQPDFKEEQQRFSRVRAAREEKAEIIAELFRSKCVSYPPEEIFIRIFKHEKYVELWARDEEMEVFKRVYTYPFTATSGVLGPKRQQGDLQIPEGFYYINRFNPASSFHVSLGIDYPNSSDRIKKTSSNPGGDIFIHGNRVTIGCIPIGNDAIKELYVIAVDARSNGQDRIPVQIFPCRMDDPANKELIRQYIDNNPTLDLFWQQVKTGYDLFERTKTLPEYTINSDGDYIFNINRQ